MATETKEVGYVFVDSGSLWIGDPCYVATKDASNSLDTWSEFCDRLDFDDYPNAQEPLGKGVGIITSTAYGDGSYPVSITYRDGIPIKLEVGLE